MSPHRRLRPSRRLLSLATAVALAATSVVTIVPAFATHAKLTLTVDTTLDLVDANPGDDICDTGSGTCSLRAAIMEANAHENHTPAATKVNDEIRLPAGIFTLTRSSGDDAAYFGDLDITETVTITGEGAGTTIIDGFGNDRVFDIATADANLATTINDLTIHNGHAVGDGGAIRHAGSGRLSLSGVEVSGSTATGDGGGIWSDSATTSTFSNSLNNVDVHDNHADGSGGGLHLATRRTGLSESSVTDNTAGVDGGGVLTVHTAGDQGVRISETTIARNVAGSDGGGWRWADDTTPLVSHRDVTIVQNRARRGAGIHVSSATVSTINGLTLVDNIGTDSGAGVYGTGPTTLTLNDTVVYGNDGPGSECGGTFVTLTLQHSVVDDCPATFVNVVTDETGGLAPLSVDPGTGREVMFPLTSWVGVDFWGSCSDGVQQPPLSPVSTTPCDVGAAEAPTTIVVDVFTDTAIGAPDACTNGVSPCSLRGALELVNPIDDPATIQLLAGTYSLANGPIALDGPPQFGGWVVNLIGAGQDESIIDASAAVEGLGESRVFENHGDKTLTVTDLTFTGGRTTGNGGAVLSAYDDAYGTGTFRRVRFVGNLADGAGGGLYMLQENDVTLEDVVFDGNTAALGGAVALDGTVRTELNVVDSLFDGNGLEQGLVPRTTHGGAIHCLGDCDVNVDRTLFVDNVAAIAGGGIYTENAGSSATVLSNSTFVDNHAGPGTPGDATPDGGALGGGAFWTTDNDDGAAVHNTFVGNTSQGDGGAVLDDSGPSAGFDFFANAFSGNEAGGDGQHCLGNFTQGAGNIADTAVTHCDNDGAPADTFATVVGDLELGPLADNGGAQQTYMPSAISPLLDASGYCVNGGVFLVDAVGLDGRGGVRSSEDGLCDTGAVDVPRPQASLEAEVRWARSPAIVPLRNLPDSAKASAVAAARNAADGGVASTPMSAIDILASPMSAIPMSAIPMSAIVLADLPYAADVLNTVLLTDIPVVGGWEDLLAGSGLQNVPLQTLTLGDVLADPVARAAFQALDVGEVDIAATPMSAIPMSAIAMGALPMSAIPINPANAGDPVAVLGDWCTLLDSLGYPCADLGIVPATPSTADNWSLAAVALAGIPMSAIPMSAIPMSAIDIGATPMSAIPMSAIDINATPMSAIPMSAIDIAGMPMSAIPMSAIPMSAIPMSAIPMSAIPMSAITITGSPMSAIPMSAIPVGTLDAAIDCTMVDCATGTLQDAFDAGAFQPGATIGDLGAALAGLRLSDMIAFMFAESLDAANTARNDPSSRLGDLAPYDDLTLGELFAFGETTLAEFIAILEAAGLFGPGGALEGMTLDDLFGGLLPFTDYPWEDIDLDAFDAQLYADDSTPIPYSLSIAAVDPLPGYDLELEVELPEGFVYVPGSTNGVDGFGEPEVTAVGDVQTLVWDVQDVQINVVPVRMSFDAFPSLQASANEASITARLPDYGTEVSKQATVFVFESLEPNNTIALSTPADPDTLYVTQISHPNDVDLYQIDVAAGDRLSILLSDLPADYDLVLYSPDDEPESLRGSNDRLLLPMDDDRLNLLRAIALEPQPLDDINLGDRYVDDTGPDVYGTSARRGVEEERIETPPLPRGGTYRVQVSGYDGAFSADSYTLRMTVREGPTLPACDPTAFEFAGEGVAPGAPPMVDMDTDTVILVNQTRLGDAFGAAEVTDPDGLMDKLDDFVTDVVGLNAMVYPVDSHSEVVDAYTAWDADLTCHPDTANDVVREIGLVLDGIRDDAPGLEHVVIVGADDQIPFARVPDRTSLANETGYASTFTGNSHLVGSLARGFLLSDEPYGDADPLGLGVRDFFVSDLALGRVVEDVDEIEGAFQRFLDFGGLLDAGTESGAFVGGYDFLTDGADEIAQLLAMPPHAPTIPPLTRDPVDTLINDSWNRAALLAELFDGDNDIASVNAHFDHFRSLPALGNATHDESDLFEVDDLDGALDSLDGTILFSMGCHSGLSVSDVQIFSPGDVNEDWAASFGEAGTAAYAANTGFGYGDTEVVALSEALMSGFARYLDGTDTVGKAFAFAKQEYASGLGANGPYDEKVVMEATFYGLPMYRIESPAVPPEVLPDEPDPGDQTVETADGSDDDTLPDLVRVDFSATAGGLLVSSSGPRGSLTSFSGIAGPSHQVTHFRPIQPLGSYDVTFQDPLTGELDLDLRGALIRSMETTSIDSAFDPVIARPILADGATEFEPRVGDVVFPSTPANVSKVRTPSGERTRLNLIFGQFRGSAPDTIGSSVVGQQTAFDNFDVDLFFGSLEATDRLAPRLDRVDAWQDGNNIQFRLEVTDASSLLEAYVLYNPTGAIGTWTEVELLDGGPLPGGRTLFTETIVDPGPGVVGSIEYLAQVVDDSGNVGVSTNKGIFHTETAAAPFTDPEPSDQPLFLFNDLPATSSWFNTAVNVKLQDFPFGTTLSVDGGEFAAVPGGGVDVTGDGVHNIVARQPGETEIPTILRIDTVDPTVSILDPVDGAEVFQSFPPDPSVVCDDALSGIRSCVVDPLDTSTLGLHMIEATATDRAGNTATTSVTYTVVEDVPELFDPPDPGPGPGPGPGPDPGPDPDPTEPTTDPTDATDPTDPTDPTTDPDRPEPQPDFPPDGVSWIFGANRYETSAMLSAARYAPGVDRVYIGTGQNFVDLLALASLTIEEAAPVLLATPPAGLPQPIVDELIRLQPRQIVVIGGPGVLADELLDRLATFVVRPTAAAVVPLSSIPDDPVVRLSGPDRFATAAAIATTAFPDGADTVVITTGLDFADAMVAAPLIRELGAPLLLAHPTVLPPATAAAIRELDPQHVVIVGGTGAIGQAVAVQAADLVGASLRRISGPDRYATAFAVAAEFESPVDTVYLAAGRAWPDALAIVPLAQEAGGPLLLLEKDHIPAATAEALRRLRALRLVAVGGRANIDEAVIEELQRYLRNILAVTSRGWPVGRLE